MIEMVFFGLNLLIFLAFGIWIGWNLRGIAEDYGDKIN